MPPKPHAFFNKHNTISYYNRIVSYYIVYGVGYITWKMGTRTGCVSGKVVRRFGVKVSYKRNTISSCTILQYMFRDIAVMFLSTDSLY